VKNLPAGCEDYSPNGELLRGSVAHVVRDDDTDYTVLNLHVVKEHGLDFTPDQIAEEWLKRMPYGMVYTAETAAYANFANGIMPPESASFRNPYREWIGAQIRADLWGYVSPGMPERAAELAFRDASISHTANGIYGEMFFAAAVSSAFVTDNIERIIEAGAGVVPAKSRFAEMVNDVVGWRRQCATWESAFDAIAGKYGRYAVCHTINNAAIVLLSLLYGGGDYGKTVGIAVMCGEDTDCNGATAGSIVGAILGARRFPRKWSECLNDRIESAVSGYSNSVISALAEETCEIARTHKG
jgi:ADP-ribosylglycohydrolase